MSGIIDTVGSKSGIIGSDVYPAGHILRSFYDESASGQTTFSTNTDVIWDELEFEVVGTNSTSDYLLVIVSLNSIFNSANSTANMRVGIRYSTDSFTTPLQFGTESFYDRSGYTNITSHSVVHSQTIVVRANHPTTSTYKIRPFLRAQEATMNINQSDVESTITGFEIKG